MTKNEQTGKMSWGRFVAMIATSTLIMFFLMYQLVYELDHATFSMNRLIASLAMGSVMTVVMLGFMWPMYEPRGRKVAVLAAGLLATVALLYANRRQVFIGDVQFMTAMIPHHSIAVNNARKAEISDPRVRELANEIIASQVREIRVMQLLLEDIDAHGERGEAPLPAIPAVVTPDMLPEIDEAVR